jgi:hypothetical protein
MASQTARQTRALQRRGVNLGERATQTFENIANGKLVNMLASMGLIERNLFQELGANTLSTIKNPVKMARSVFNNGNPVKSAAKSVAGDWATPPKNVSEFYRYLIGNIYKTAMIPTEAVASGRAGAFRTELTQWFAKDRFGEELSLKEAENLSRAASNVTESVVNMYKGVENGMVNIRHANKALKAWKEFIQTGSKSDFDKLKTVIDRQESVAERLTRGFDFGGNSKSARAFKAALNTAFPYVRTAFNLTELGVKKTLNPISKSLIDELLGSRRVEI